MSAPATPAERCEVAIVGGGPAGAALAVHLARRGRDVVLLERQPAYHWRAGGVFSSPATVTELAALGIDALGLDMARPIPRLWLEIPGAPPLPLNYGRRTVADPSAVGFDRAALDPHLLDCARAAGADVRTGAQAAILDLDRPRLAIAGRELRADVLVGADGIRSGVARAAGVVGTPWLPRRIGLTCHLPETGTPGDARLVVLRDGYCGLAPVPGGRVNVGIVLGEGGERELRRRGAAAILASTLASLPPLPDGSTAPVPGPQDGVPVDRLVGASPLSHAVTRRAGRRWLLVGDAAGFLDPFSGEGLHRAFVSARIAAEAIERFRAGRTASLDHYDRAMRRRFLGKDVVSGLVQAFLGRPALLRYTVRRLVTRTDLAKVLELVIADLAPASTSLDPRVLIRLLAP